MSRRVIIYAGVAYEPETIRILNRVGITNNSTIYFSGTPQENTGQAIWAAVNKYFVSFKSPFGLPLGIDNIALVASIIYLYIGDTAAQLKFNAVNDADSDAAFRQTFGGGWGYSATGINPNGVNTYANIHWISQGNAGLRRLSWGIYYRNNEKTGTQAHGCWDLTNPTRIYNVISASNFTFGNQVNNYVGDTTKMHSVRMDGTDQVSYRDGVQTNSVSSADLTLSNIPFYIGARNNNNSSINLWTRQEVCYFDIIDKVTVTDAQRKAVDAAVK